MAAEADYDGTVTDDVPPFGYRDYPGSVRIAIPHVYTTFYARLKFTNEISQERKSSLRYNLKEVYAKTEITHEKIYPVKYFFMGS